MLKVCSWIEEELSEEELEASDNDSLDEERLEEDSLDERCSEDDSFWLDDLSEEESIEEE